MTLAGAWKTLMGNDSASVAVIGDIMLDRYLIGSSERISPEGPVPIVLVESEMVRLGGSGNVVANLKGLGVASLTVGVVGKDAAGQEVRRRLDELGCDADYVLELPDRPTTEKSRIIARNQQVVRIDREVTAEYEDHVYRTLADGLTEVLSRADVCILSDYEKGVCTPPAFVREVIRRARLASVPVVVDPKGRDFGKYRGADCITPNLKEIEAVVRLEGSGDDAVLAAARQLSQRFDIRNVLVTRSAEGMSLLTGSQSHHFDARAQEVYDVSGAGDTVVAAVAAGLASGLGYADSAALANVAAGIVVGKLGTAPVGRREMERQISLKDGRKRQAMIASVDEWLTSAGRWCDPDDRVLLLDGFVEEVNSRTVDALERAAREGDVLVVLAWPVATRDDAPGRKDSVDQRILAGIAAVDVVLVLDGGRYADQIGRLRPDVVVRADCFEARPSTLCDGIYESAEIVHLTSGSEE